VLAGDAGYDIKVTLIATASPTHSWYTPDSLRTSTVIAGEYVVNTAKYSVAVSPLPTHGTVEADVNEATSGDPVTISVTPDPGYTADTGGLSVSGGGPLTPTPIGNGKFTFTMGSASVTISGVTFIPKQYTLTMDESIQHGLTSVSGGSTGLNDTDTVVTINPTPDPGYTTGWRYYYNVANPDNKIYLMNGATSFNMPAYNIKVGATFTPILYTIAKDTNSGGSIAINPTLRTSALTDAVVKLTVTPDSGKKIKTLYLKETGTEDKTQLDVNASSFVMPPYNVTVGATFETLNAAVPVISAQPQGYSQSNAPAATPLSVTASNPGSGTLSYAWYKSSAYGTDIAEATHVGTNSSTYTPAKTIGNTYYFVIVTNTYLGETSQTISDIALVTFIGSAATISSYIIGGVSDGTLGTPNAVSGSATAGVVNLNTTQATSANFTAAPKDGATLRFAYTTGAGTPTFAKWTARDLANNSYVWIEVTSADGSATNI
jgi:hypothetical protein